MNSNQTIRPFHLAFPIKSVKETEQWYTDILGCTVGRKSNHWIDFDFFGHQVVGHLVNNIKKTQTTEVDKNNVPSRHFGIILTPKEWKKLATHLEHKNINFKIKPHTRFKNKVGQQYTMFIEDPSGNFLEFKAFEDDGKIFAK